MNQVLFLLGKVGKRGKVIVQCGGGGQGKKEFLFDILALGEGFLEDGVWALIQGKTKVYHRVRLEDADSPIVAAMKSLFTRFFLILP